MSFYLYTDTHNNYRIEVSSKFVLVPKYLNFSSAKIFALQNLKKKKIQKIDKTLEVNELKYKCKIST